MHPGESVEEKISLSERFGLWISFYPFAQDDYLAAVAALARAFRRQAAAAAREARRAHARGAAVRAAARLAQRPRRLAVRARLRGRARRCAKSRRASVSVTRRSRRRGGDPARRTARVLLAQRPPGKPYAGYWEFPGGKLEPGETPRARARARAARGARHRACGAPRRGSCRSSSIRTRTSSCISSACSIATASRIGHDGQAFAWQDPGAIRRRAAAARQHARAGGADAAARLRDQLRERSRRGGVPRRAHDGRSRRACGWSRCAKRPRSGAPRCARRGAWSRLRSPHGAQVLLNGTADDARASAAPACTGRRRALTPRRRARATSLVAASCHTHADVMHAAALDVDFAVLGPVRATPTHPDATPLGWDGFAAAIAGTRVPVFALGGLQADGSPHRASRTARTALRCAATPGRRLSAPIRRASASGRRSLRAPRGFRCGSARSPRRRGRSACTAPSRTAAIAIPAPTSLPFRIADI